MSRSGITLALTAIAIFGFAQAGSAEGRLGRLTDHLDKSFGEDGIATHHFAKHSTGTGVAETSDGGIIQGANTGSSPGAIVKFSRKGQLDKSFGRKGLARLTFGSRTVESRDVLVDRHDRILAAGTTYSKSYRGAIGRLKANGRVDKSFSGDGFARLPKLGRVVPMEMVFASGGKIVVVGLIEKGNSEGVCVTRFLADGRLDLTFSGNGYRIIAAGSTQSSGGVAIDGRGRIVVGAGDTIRIGAKKNRRADVFSVIRLKSDGQLDRSFSEDGRMIIDASGPNSNDSWLSDVTLDRRNRILAVGGNGFSQGIVARIQTSGILDASFANEGIKTLPFGPSSVSVDRKGRIVSVGSRSFEWSNPESVVSRLRPNGAEDFLYESELNEPGHTGSYSGLGDHFLDSRGRIVAGGFLENVADVIRLAKR